MYRFLIAAIFISSIAGGIPSPAAKAIEAANAAIANDPEQPEHYNALALALARRARETADHAYYQHAEKAISRSLELSPDNFDALKTKAWVMLGKHEFAAALELAKQLNRRMPDDVTVYGLLTDAHAELGNYKEAEDSAQWMLNIGRSSVPGLTRAAYLRELFGDIDGALELMNSSFHRIHPDEAEDRAWVLTQSGHLLALTGRTEEASKVLSEALRLMPGYHYALAALAKARADAGDYAEAERLLRRRYEVAPHPENLFDLGAALWRAGKRKEALQVLRKFEKDALAESKSWDNANRELVAYYADFANNPQAALRIARTEIVKRHDIYTLDAYAWALHRSGKHKEAKGQIDAALAVGTVDPRILYHAGSISLALNLVDEAQRHLRRSLDTNGRSEVAARVRRLLDRIPAKPGDSVN